MTKLVKLYSYEGLSASAILSQQSKSMLVPVVAVPASPPASLPTLLQWLLLDHGDVTGGGFGLACSCESHLL